MNQHKILVIDDESSIRETLSELLTLENYEVKNAENGQIALDILDDWIPELIICDIMMPVIDVQAFQKTVYNNKLLSTIPFIILTAKVGENLMRNCFNEGADDFLAKPFKVKELLTIENRKI